jgi:acetyl esterase
MPLDPQVASYLARAAALQLRPYSELTAPEARSQSEAQRAATAVEPVARVEDIIVSTADGPLTVRLYAPASSEPLPALVFFHGGGWVIGSVDGSDATCRALANRAGCAVISVEYRLAPEHKYPAAADDCYAATQWVVENAAALGIDPARVAVGGVSAGGNLAAVVAQMVRDRGGPALAFQLLVVPVTSYDLSTPSYSENAEGYGLSRASMVWFWNHYLRDAADANDPYAAPLRAASLAGLPPALVQTAEYDPLRDEGAAYAGRLADAGVEVEYTCHAGMVHGFFSMAGILDGGNRALDQAAVALRRALGVRQAEPAG